MFPNAILGADVSVSFLSRLLLLLMQTTQEKKLQRRPYRQSWIDTKKKHFSNSLPCLPPLESFVSPPDLLQYFEILQLQMFFNLY